MGFRFRKSVKMGPVRVNLSKSGVGYSVGGKGFRVTKRADGKVQTTASIPGTGLSYTETLGSSRKTGTKKVSAAASAAAVTASSTQGASTSAQSKYHIQPQRQTPKKGGGGMKGWLAGGLAALALGIGAGALMDGGEEAEPSGTLPQQVVTQVTPEVSTEPESPEVSGEAETPVEQQPMQEAPAVEPEVTPEPTPEPEPEPEPEVTPSAPAVVPVAPVVTPDPQPEQTTQSNPQAAMVIGNSNTKKYHYPSCSSVDEMNASHRVEIESAEAARSMGYEACKRCH